MNGMMFFFKCFPLIWKITFNQVGEYSSYSILHLENAITPILYMYDNDLKIYFQYLNMLKAVIINIWLITLKF